MFTKRRAAWVCEARPKPAPVSAIATARSVWRSVNENFYMLIQHFYKWYNLRESEELFVFIVISNARRKYKYLDSA
jgi:hypothetical protein